MRKSKFSEHQIIAILKAVEAGRTVKDASGGSNAEDPTTHGGAIAKSPVFREG